MEIILHAFDGILTVMLMIATGFFLERLGWFKEQSIQLIARLVTQICLPTYMLTNLLANFKHDQLLSMSSGLIVPVISMLAGYVLSKLIAKAVNIPFGRRGVFSTCVCFSNTIFIGLPLGIALFGDAGAPYVMIYYMVNTTLFWTLGVHEISSDAGKPSPLFSKETLKSVFSLPLAGFILGVIMVLLEIDLPKPLFDSCHYIGSMTTPLAMLFIGIAMSKTPWKEIHFDRYLAVAMIGRYLISPLLVIVLLPFFNLDIMMQRVFVMMAAMPAMTNTAIVSKAYGGDYRYAAMLTAVSTCLAVIMVPFYMWVIH